MLPIFRNLSRRRRHGAMPVIGLQQIPPAIPPAIPQAIPQLTHEQLYDTWDQITREFRRLGRRNPRLIEQHSARVNALNSKISNTQAHIHMWREFLQPSWASIRRIPLGAEEIRNAKKKIEELEQQSSSAEAERNRLLAEITRLDTELKTAATRMREFISQNRRLVSRVQAAIKARVRGRRALIEASRPTAAAASESRRRLSSDEYRQLLEGLPGNEILEMQRLRERLAKVASDEMPAPAAAPAESRGQLEGLSEDEILELQSLRERLAEVPSNEMPAPERPAPAPPASRATRKSSLLGIFRSRPAAAATPANRTTRKNILGLFKPRPAAAATRKNILGRATRKSLLGIFGSRPAAPTRSSC